MAWNCEIQLVESVSARMQWTRTFADVINCVFYYAWPVLILLFLFRPHQLKGIKTKLILVSFVMFILHAVFRAVLQVFGKPFFNLSALCRALSNVPVFIFVFTNVCVQFFFVARHLVVRPKAEQACVICKMAIPPCSTVHRGLCHQVCYLHSVRQARHGRQTCNCPLLPSHWCDCQSNFTNLCSAVVEHYPSGIFLRFISTVVLLIGCYVSSLASGA